MQQPNAYTKNLISILGEMARTSAEILQAGAIGDDTAVRIGVDRIRQLRSNLKAADPKYIEYFDTRPEQEKIQIQDHLIQIRKSEKFLKAWTQRYKDIAPREVLIGLDGGPDAILDMDLPDVWDWNADIVFFSNQCDPSLIKSAINRGQKRVLVFKPEATERKDAVIGATYVSIDADVGKFFESFQHFFPTQICILNIIAANEVGPQAADQEAYEAIAKTIQKRFDLGRATQNTTRVFGNKWLNQGVQNLSAIAMQPSFKHLAPHVDGKPFVIISPGPSLDKNIKFLKNIKDKAILLAPAQSIMALSKANIYPDIVMVADPGDLLYLFEDFDMSKISSLLVGVACHPELYKRYKEKIISLNVNSEFDSWISKMLDDQHHMGSSGSVSSMAFVLAGMMHCNPIILVGQDLSFAGVKQYAENAADGAIKVEFDEGTGLHRYEVMTSGLGKMYEGIIDKNTQTVSSIREHTLTLPGYYGGTVQTKPDYAMFHYDFERWAAEYLKQQPTLRLLNCTEGGAYIKGFEHISLNEAIDLLNKDSYPAINKVKLFAQVFGSIDQKNRQKRLLLALRNIDAAFSASTVLANQCHLIASKIIKGHSNLNDLVKKEAELIRNVNKSDFIAIAIQDEIKSAIKLGESANNLEENLEAKMILYKLIVQEAKKLHPYVASTIKELQSS